MKTIKITTDKILGAYGILNSAPLFGVKDKIGVIKILKILRPINENFSETRDFVCEKCKPENYDELYKRFTEGEEHALDGYLFEVNKSIEDELKTDIEISFEPISTETLCELCTEREGDKQLTGGQMLELMDIFCDE